MTRNKAFERVLLVLFVLIAVACGWTPSNYSAREEGMVGDAEQALATPAGNDASFAGQSVPSTMQPGQVAPATVTMCNTGWTTWTGAGWYALGSQSPQDNGIWGLGRVYLSPATSITSGQCKQFVFNITAPSTPGTYNFQWRMLREWVEWFGAVSPLVQIQVAAPAGNGASFAGQSVPSTMQPGQVAPATVTMCNTGGTAWTGAGWYALGSQSPQDNLTWGLGRVYLSPTASITPGQCKQFVFNITAPSTPGTYNFQWRMLREWVEWFGAVSPVVQIQVVVPPPTATDFFVTGNQDHGETYFEVPNTVKPAGATTQWMTFWFHSTNMNNNPTGHFAIGLRGQLVKSATNQFEVTGGTGRGIIIGHAPDIVDHAAIEAIGLVESHVFVETVRPPLGLQDDQWYLISIHVNDSRYIAFWMHDVYGNLIAGSEAVVQDNTGVVTEGKTGLFIVYIRENFAPYLWSATFSDIGFGWF